MSTCHVSTYIQEYGRMIHMLQGYCLISTGIKISCCHQIGKKYVGTDTNINRLIYVHVHVHVQMYLQTHKYK